MSFTWHLLFSSGKEDVLRKKCTYMYDGPVLSFDRGIDKRYFALTTAVSENQARNNLTFRYKMEKGFAPNARISLPGKIILVT